MKHTSAIAYRAEVRNEAPENVRLMEGDVKAITGYRADDFRKGRIEWSGLIFPEHLAPFRRFRKKLIVKPGIPRILEYAIRHRDGSIRWVADHAAAFGAGRSLAVQGILSDISGRKRAEVRILHLNRVLAGIRGVNQLITREKRIERLLKKACRLLTESRGYRHVWIVLTGLDRQSTAFFESGAAAAGPSFAVSIGGGELPPAARKALRQADPVVCGISPGGGPAQSPAVWGDLMVRLDHGNRVYGLMGATLPLPLVREKEEHALLREVAGDIGSALHGIAQEEKRRNAESLAAERENMLGLIYENAFDGISIYEEFTAENRRILIDCNQRYCDISGRPRAELFRLGDTRTLQNNLHKAYATRREFVRDLKGQSVYQGHFSWIRPDGRENAVEFVAVLVERGGRQFVVGIDRDVTERRRNEEMLEASLAEKEILLREIHHRVKNNLQIIVSLLNLQASHTDDQRLSDVFNESKNRIYMMALVHETLYNSDNFANIKFNEYIKNMTQQILRIHSNPSAVEIDFDLEDVSLGLSTAIPCALILNELLSNSLKHAFRDGRPGRIRIFLKKEEAGGVQIGVSDNGCGLPESIDAAGARTMGLSLVRMLTSQLSGKLKVGRGDGTSFLIHFHA
jgi:PAS domain S-box-containing protein